MQVFAFLETSHLFNRFFSWPLTTIDAGRWQENIGSVTCNFIARNGHIALLEHLDQSVDFKFKTKFRTPKAVGAAFRGAAEGGHLVICKWLRVRYSWGFCQDSWFIGRMCEAAAESGSMELCKWLKGAGLPWDWRWVHAAAPDST